MTKKYNIIRSVPRGENVVASDVAAKKRVGFRAAFAYVSDFTFGRKCMACCLLLLVLLVCLWYSFTAAATAGGNSTQDAGSYLPE